MNEFLPLLIGCLTCLISGVGMGFIYADYHNRNRMNNIYDTFTTLYRRSEEFCDRQNKLYEQTIESLREAVKTHEKATKATTKHSSKARNGGSKSGKCRLQSTSTRKI